MTRYASFGPFLAGCWCWCCAGAGAGSVVVAVSVDKNQHSQRKKKKKTHTVKGSRHPGLNPSYPPANLHLCWWLGVPAVAAVAAAAGVGGVMLWWCGDDTGTHHSKIY